MKELKSETYKDFHIIFKRIRLTGYHQAKNKHGGYNEAKMNPMGVIAISEGFGEIEGLTKKIVFDEMKKVIDSYIKHESTPKRIKNHTNGTESLMAKEWSFNYNTY